MILYVAVNKNHGFLIGSVRAISSFSSSRIANRIEIGDVGLDVQNCGFIHRVHSADSQYQTAPFDQFHNTQSDRVRTVRRSCSEYAANLGPRGCGCVEFISVSHVLPVQHDQVAECFNPIQTGLKSGEYFQRAEGVFGPSLPGGVLTCLVGSSGCSYGDQALFQKHGVFSCGRCEPETLRTGHQNRSGAMKNDNVCFLCQPVDGAPARANPFSVIRSWLSDEGGGGNPAVGSWVKLELKFLRLNAKIKNNKPVKRRKQPSFVMPNRRSAMFFEFFLSLRYLRAKRKQAFISVITVISVIGVTVGVMSLVVVLSVMNGFREELTSKIMGVNAHVLVTDGRGALTDYREIGKRINEMEGVAASTPFLYSQVMTVHDGGSSIAVLRGLDIQSAGEVLDISSMIKDGKLEDLVGEDGEGMGIMIGSQLAAKIGAVPGESVTLLVPGSSGDGLPVSEVYRVLSLFESGMYDYDSSLVFLPLGEAQRLLGAHGRVNGLEVRALNPEASGVVAERIRSRLGYPYSARDWKTMHRNLFQMLSMQKAAIGVILAMIVLVGVLSIVGTLFLAVMEKTKDIGILRTMGASARRIMMLFVMQGLIVGVAGTASGIVLGLGICSLLERYRFIDIPADVYWLSSLSVRVEPREVALVAAGAVILSFLATLYPSWRAASENPADAVRYE